MPEKVKEDNKSPPVENGDNEISEVLPPPDWIIPLFLTTGSQAIFECKVDEDVTADNPSKLISKEKIFEDMKNRLSISDFHPVKDIIEVRNVG